MKLRTKLAQLKMVALQRLTMKNCKKQLCPDAEASLIQSNKPKMLAAYPYKLSPAIEKLMIELGLHKMLKVYRFELDVPNQIFLVQSNNPKMMAAYKYRLCPEATTILQAQQNPRMLRAVQKT